MAIIWLMVVVIVPLGVCALAKKYPFQFKMSVFYILCTAGTAIVLPFMLFRPRDYRNALIPGMLARCAGRLIGVTMEVKGVENVKKGHGGVVIINHQSALDLLVLAYLWPVIGRGTVVAKIEILYIPIFGLGSYLWGTLFINRKNRSSSVRSLEKEAKAINEHSAKLLIFPEGSRNQSDKLLPFKKGAFHIALDSKCPIQPVAISKYYFLDSKTKRFDRGHAIIHILPEVETDEFTKDNMHDLMDRCRDIIQDKYNTASREVLEFKKHRKFEQ